MATAPPSVVLRSLIRIQRSLAAMGHLFPARGAVAGKALRHPRLDPAPCLLDQAALGGAADDRLERRPRHHQVGHAGIEQIAIAAVAQHQPVVPVEQGEALGDALDRVDQTLPGLGNLAQTLVLDLDRGIAKHRERARHLGDFVLAVGRRQRHAQIAPGDRQHAAAQRGEAPQQIALDV